MAGNVLRKLGVRRPLAAALFFIALFGALGITVLATQYFGAEFGEPCVQGGFACRNDGIGEARCLMGPGEQGFCTRLCAEDQDCPSGFWCGEARWFGGPKDREGTRPEWVCLRR
jgi:hypothetical protein